MEKCSHQRRGSESRRIIYELDEVLKQCKKKKAAGSDGLSVELYKYGSLSLQQCLIHLFNNFWKYATRLLAWKVSMVQPIHKNGSKDM